MIFEVKGKINEKGRMKPFTRVIEAKSEKLAAEKIKCLFGSEHKLSRRHIMIESVNKLGDKDAAE